MHEMSENDRNFVSEYLSSGKGFFPMNMFYWF